MPRQRRRSTESAALEQTDRLGLAAKRQEYLDWLRVRNYSARTVKDREECLGHFIIWCAERGIARPGEVTKPIMERYQRHLYYLRHRDGRPLSFSRQYRLLSPVRSFFKWLARYNHILYNPASELELPKLEKRLPRHVLTASETERVLSLPVITELLGLRDRAVMETLYSTGIRRMELTNLLVFDLDIGRGTLMVRQGKGKKDRTVPIGERAVMWIEKYLSEVRPSLVVEPDEHVLFLTCTGEPLVPSSLSGIVRGYVKAAALGKSGACHLFRHTCATLMLENGADVRYVQELLGHANLSTTQIYTHVSIRQLKQIHAATHPARLSRPESSGEAGELLSALIAESEEDELDDEI